METSRRAVESYWRSRLIDSATSDEDKVAPVYKLEEICELLRSSHVSIVKEVSDFVLKRLDHKSPIVKQKALRLIKYAVGKSGAEFRREMQRHSVAIRQLLHHKGQLDPLKGDALNKAVRETAQEAVSAIFSEENSNNNYKAAAAPSQDLNRRIQGFGNTNYEPPPEDIKSFISEVVGIGSASIKQGLHSLTQGHSLMKNETGSGSYKSPNLQRSLTVESERGGDRYEPVAYRSENQSSFGLSKNQSSGSWNQDSRVNKMEISNGESSGNSSEIKTREDRLLETIVTSGGVRLQPSRDAIQAFLTEAAKLDALALSHALELKLQSPIWQVRMKAVCVLESILRLKDDDHFSHVASYFTENKDVVLRCSESPQASLREKAIKVLSLLGGDQPNSSINSEKAVKTGTATVAELPDLIDTGYSNDNNLMDNSTNSTDEQNIGNLTSSTPLVDDLFGDISGSIGACHELKNDDDPFADVSFHTGESKEHADDLFSGMTVGDDKQGDHESRKQGIQSDPQLFDLFGSSSKQGNHNGSISDLMGGLSIDENTSSTKPKGTSSIVQSESLFSGLNNHTPDNTLGGMLGSQAQPIGFNVNPMFPTGHMPYNMPPGIMLNQPYPTQPLNYGAMGTLLAQQQLLATMANFQHISNVNMRDGGVSQMVGPNGASPLPDIFQPNLTSQTPSSIINNSKKEDNTKAFDFISDHLASARDSRRVI